MSLYAPIILGVAGSPACPDKYNEASTLVCPGAKRFVLQSSVQAIFVQFGLMPQGRSGGAGSVQWQSEEPWMPVIASLGRNFDAVRVRNFVPGKEAQVLLSVA
jgi:hypothetical protein